MTIHIPTTPAQEATLSHLLPEIEARLGCDAGAAVAAAVTQLAMILGVHSDPDAPPGDPDAPPVGSRWRHPATGETAVVRRVLRLGDDDVDVVFLDNGDKWAGIYFAEQWERVP